jgi:hypothetical protein
MSRLLVALLLSAVTLSPITANAFDLKVPEIGSKSGSSGSTDLSGSQTQLVKEYVSANKSVLDGNSKMAEAVGLKNEAAAARVAGDSLTEGATKSSLSDADKASSDTSKAVSTALKTTGTLDAPSKAKFADGMLSLSQGLAKYVGMKGSLTSFTSGLKSVSPTVLPTLQTGSYIASSAPTNIKNLSSALSNAIAFAKSNDIVVPADATDVLSKL